MPGGFQGVWRKALQLLRGPSFKDLLDESSENLRDKEILMVCPVCKQRVPMSPRCPNCGSPRHRPVDRRV